MKQGDKVMDVGTAESSNGGPQIISVKGMLGKITEQSIITQSGATRMLTTLHIAGPAVAKIAIQFWNSNTAESFQDFLHKPVVVKKMRAFTDLLRGSTFESINRITTVTLTDDEELLTWWLTPM